MMKLYEDTSSDWAYVTDDKDVIIDAGHVDDVKERLVRMLLGDANIIEARLTSHATSDVAGDRPLRIGVGYHINEAMVK